MTPPTAPSLAAVLPIKAPHPAAGDPGDLAKKKAADDVEAGGIVASAPGPAGDYSIGWSLVIMFARLLTPHLDPFFHLILKMPQLCVGAFGFEFTNVDGLVISAYWISLALAMLCMAFLLICLRKITSLPCLVLAWSAIAVLLTGSYVVQLPIFFGVFSTTRVNALIADGIAMAILVGATMWPTKIASKDLTVHEDVLCGVLAFLVVIRFPLIFREVRGYCSALYGLIGLLVYSACSVQDFQVYALCNMEQRGAGCVVAVACGVLDFFGIYLYLIMYVL